VVHCRCSFVMRAAERCWRVSPAGEAVLAEALLLARRSLVSSKAPPGATDLEEPWDLRMRTLEGVETAAPAVLVVIESQQLDMPVQMAEAWNSVVSLKNPSPSEQRELQDQVVSPEKHLPDLARRLRGEEQMVGTAAALAELVVAVRC
jgi:hypothetical protein